MFDSLTCRWPKNGSSVMTNQPLNECYETTLKSIDVKRDCASAQSYLSGAEIFVGNTSRTKACYIWTEHYCLSVFMLLPSIMVTLYALWTTGETDAIPTEVRRCQYIPSWRYRRRNRRGSNSYNFVWRKAEKSFEILCRQNAQQLQNQVQHQAYQRQFLSWLLNE